MNKFLYNLIKVLFSVFGLGFVPKFSKILTAFLALALVLLIDDSYRPELVGLIVVTSILLHAIVIGNIAKYKMNFENVALDRAIGVWITVLSPFILYSWEWLLIDFVLYIIIFSLIDFSTMESLKKYKIDSLFREISTGIICLVLLNVIYSGFNIFSVLKMFFIKL